MKLAKLLTALALAAGLAAASPGRAAPPPKTPRLVVMISVDQYAWSLFERYRGTYTGGMKRLADGRVFLGYESHAATETCPGHSTLLTGDHPSRTGIVSNNWYDRETGGRVYCVAVPGAGAGAMGPQNLKVDTLGDWLRARDPEARVATVSGKDRAAIMLGGHHATSVFWWNDNTGWGTSRYAGPDDDATVAPAKAMNARIFAGWDAAPPQLWPSDIPARCRAMEAPHTFGRLAISGRVPPDSAKVADSWRKTPLFNADFRASPMMDHLTLEMAAELVKAQGLGRKHQDLLAVSLSANDHVAHRFGSGGAEMCVQQAQMDAALGAFFAKLDALKIPYVVALSADHGGIDAAERMGARRVDPFRMFAALNADLRARFALAYDPVNAGDANQLMVLLKPADAARRAEVTAAAVAWLKRQPDVAQVYTAGEVAAAAPPKGKPAADLTILERFAESFDTARSGDIQVNFVQFSTVGMPSQPGQLVAGHGSAWDHDRQVPVLFWWPGVTPAREKAAIETVDIAPTLAPFLHVKAPDVDGRCVELGQGCPK